MKYKKGDKVVIRSDLKSYTRYGKFKACHIYNWFQPGKIVIIDNIMPTNTHYS